MEVPIDAISLRNVPYRNVIDCYNFSVNFFVDLYVCSSDALCLLLFQTSASKSGALRHDIHYWLGEDTSQVCFYLEGFAACCFLNVLIVESILLG